MVRGELVDESGGSPLEWIGLIRAARNPQEQTLEAIADLPGGQVLWAPPPTPPPILSTKLSLMLRAKHFS